MLVVKVMDTIRLRGAVRQLAPSEETRTHPTRLDGWAKKRIHGDGRAAVARSRV